MKNINESLINLRNYMNSKSIPENENRKKKIVNIAEKIYAFNKQPKGKGCPLDLAKRMKIFTLKKMLHGLPIALAQVKTSNTSEKLI